MIIHVVKTTFIVVDIFGNQANYECIGHKWDYTCYNKQVID